MINIELEITPEMEERNDEIDNSVFECVSTLSEKELEWDMQLIGEVTDAIKSVLERYGITVRHPGVVTEADGSQHYAD
jgi:hypothetical protein